ncbi:transcriptional regulator family: Fungal Specific TF [Penicillium roqueforti]|uniref:transcriptional regulator family: Fungal Specific TF n=1 Tax=Penicillium roqueforti TaxID=5082 RepID=UPI00190D2BA5|nr:transcriptional regulator family: Fungal Specific TF [Penicillium roqueforti]KAF9252791.1 transcriptional regulator family: Fungal Specific TF [Penicillium roqueforti]KAI1830698.1 transcriptional regulator family: Fungal Specific TF [Penicillium roqueforti]KAI2675314.1 transcriptional regulator family: Fungal Specific TF [Penicillium roqueforti]KAI2679208.1 transcriptional regulator family: Fungal Specific TF [Penicillium roqueforti]KAI2724196.1 transcriptional regulator family: Fungal Spec
MRGHIFGEDRKASDENPRTQLEQKQVIHSRTKSLTTNITPSFALQDPCIHNLDRSSRFYLDYYNLRVAKLFILYDIAVAARHFANAGQSFDQVSDGLSPRFINANLDAFHFKQQAIKALSLSLSHPEPSQKDAIMPAILLLIFLDLLESGIEGWKYHLRGAEGLVNLSHSMLESSDSKSINGNPGETVEETRRFITRQFSLVSTFGGALSGTMNPLFEAFWDVLYSFLELSVISRTKDTARKFAPDSPTWHNFLIGTEQGFHFPNLN